MTDGSSPNAVFGQLDLLAISALAVLTVAVVVLDIGGVALHVVLVTPFIIFAPGYALAALLFPESARPASPEEADVPDTGSMSARLLDRSGLTTVERIALSVTASAALSAMIAFIDAFAIGVYATPFALGVAGFTVCASGVAVARRLSLPPSRRSAVHPGTRVRRFIGRHFRPSGAMRRSSVPFEATTRRDVLVNLVIVMCAIGFVAGVGVAAMIPQSQPYSEFYTVANNGHGGNASLVGSASAGAANRTLVVANHEGHPVQYTVVMKRQTVSNGQVTGSHTISTSSKQVADNQTWKRPIDLSGVQSGDNVRIQFELYKGQQSGNPDLTLRLWYRGGGSTNADVSGGNG